MKHRGGMRVVGKRTTGSLAGGGTESGGEGERQKGREEGREAGGWGGEREWEGLMKTGRTWVGLS